MTRPLLIFLLINLTCSGQDIFHSQHFFYNGKLRLEAKSKKEGTFSRLKVASETRYFKKNKLWTFVYDSLGREIFEYIYSDNGDTSSIYKIKYSNDRSLSYTSELLKDLETKKVESSNSKIFLNHYGLDSISVYINDDGSRDSSSLFYNQHLDLTLTKHFKITKNKVLLDSIVRRYNYTDGLITSFTDLNKRSTYENNTTYLNGLVNECIDQRGKTNFIHDQSKRLVQTIYTDLSGQKKVSEITYYPNGLLKTEGNYKVIYTYRH